MKLPLFLAVCLWLGLVVFPAEGSQPNVLFIAVDDLRVELGCYGSAHVKSPNLDRLASQGLLFERAYCQQTVCNPSRASLLTGLRPDTLRVWDLPTHFRQNKPEVITLPQLFRRNGYHAQCVGKIFHNWRQDDWKGDAVSWSVPSVLHYNSHGNDKPITAGDLPPNLASGREGIECRDVPDDAYFDGRVAATAINVLREISNTDKPFFLAVGFWKPHTPFNAPKKYWDQYQRDSIPLPANVMPPADVPAIALTSARYRGGPDSADLREMHHGHLAAISYLDAQIGKVLRELDQLGLRDSTIVVFWSDHGLHLGEHGLTRKTTAFELDAHVPLIISAPSHANAQRTDALVELLDIYPTLTDLCGLDPPPDLEGVSLVPLLRDPMLDPKTVALTQTPRPNYPRGRMPEVMGYSVRSDRYRYTEWRDFQSGDVQARELYDHDVDPAETINLANQQSQQAVVSKLEATLAKVLEKQSASVPYPDPVTNPDSPQMLSGQWMPADPHQIDHSRLPKLPSQHAVVSDVRGIGGVNQHNYLVHHDGRFFAMWSDGPGVEDRVGQRVKVATSVDGLTWSEPKFLTPEPPGSGPASADYGTRSNKGFRYISRGFWQRDGELYALASLDEAAGFFGPSLKLHAFQLNSEQDSWDDLGVMVDDAINNFPPNRLPSGQWMMSRRPHNYKQIGVEFLIGGVSSLQDWKSIPVLGTSSDLKAEEPLWWVLPDDHLMALFRDNRGSKFLYRAFSTDHGRSWSRPVRTNFPDATSKLFGFRLTDGRYVLISNSNPRARDPLTIAISEDGLVFTKLAYLVGGRHVDYPHAIEHDGYLLIAFAGKKQSVEILKVKLSDLEMVKMPANVSLPEPTATDR